jgi:hypothetical protein
MFHIIKMRIRYVVLLLPLVILLPFMLIAANGSLNEGEKIIIGLVIIAVAQIVRWLLQLWKKEKLNKRWAYVIAIAVSFVLALVFRFPALPPFPGWDQFFTWLGDVVKTIDGVIFWAIAIYNIFLPELLDKLGDIIEQRFQLRVKG